jgi:hypothetical protein
MKTIDQILSQLDQCIKSGNLEEVKKSLKSLLSQQDISTSQRVTIGSLYRRIGSPKETLKLLRPIVIGRGRKLPESNPLAKIEYAAALIQLDLVDEGRRILSSPDTFKYKDANRWRALSFLHDFQLARASEEIIKHLNEYSDNSYDQLVLEVNLLVALLGELEQPTQQCLFKELSKSVENKIDVFRADRLRSAYQSLRAQGVFFSNSECKHRNQSRHFSPELRRHVPA